MVAVLEKMGSLSFMQYMDTLAQAMAIIVFVILFNRIASRSSEMHLSFWFAGALAFAAISTAIGREGNLAVNPYMLVSVLLAFAFWGAGYWAHAFRGTKWVPYVIITMFTGVMFYGVIGHYWDGVPGQVLQTPFFAGIMTLSLIGCIGGPIVSFATGKSNIHALWATAGWILITIASYVQWAAAAHKPGALTGGATDPAVYFPTALGFTLIVIALLKTGVLKEA
ncbi:MAG: hypothetical protein WDA53_09245 [Bacillota bacterium]